MKIHTISADNFANVIDEELCDAAVKKIDKYKFKYRELTNAERIRCISDIKKTLRRPLKASGTKRRKDWESGWKEHEKILGEAKFNFSSLIPRYFGKIPYVRWDGKLIYPLSNNFEYGMLSVLESQFFNKYLANASTIYEFGCGTGHNLFRAREVNSKAKIVGLDWAKSPQHLLGYLNNKHILSCHARKFDFFKPDLHMKFDDNSVIYTVAALEQVGENHDPFVKFLLQKKPGLCLHIEPVMEVLDPKNNELDYLCIRYCQKRNYLKNFLKSLRQKESEGWLKILEAKRTNIGSFYVEGYAVVAWKPL